jgi:hypothetical protein
MHYLPKLAVALIAAFSSAALAGPTELSMDELDRITAGGANDQTGGGELNASGGAIVGNDSEANWSWTANVVLSDNAQEGAQALNLVNSSNSMVADGVNVWDGTLLSIVGFGTGEGGTAAEGGATYLIEQANVIEQNERSDDVATLATYDRAERTLQEVEVFVPDETEPPVTINTHSDRSPFFLRDAQAEYIVIDDSEIVVTHLNEVLLSGSAQQNAQAVNLVNAAGSAVANGVNIAVNLTGELTTSGQMLELSQRNVVTQAR